MKDQARGRAEAQSRSKGRMIWIVAGVLAVVAAIIFGAVYWITHNYAQDAAKPLERVLSNGGAVKVCTQGDAGRGPDNFAPGYEARYEFSGGKDEAVELVTRAAAENGYSLTHQSSPYPYISWYSDNAGKKSDYPGFSNGNIKVSFNVYGEGDEKLYCGERALRADATHAAISLGVTLPSSK